MPHESSDSAAALAEISHRFYGRGWVLGTSGNFSVIASRDPLRIAITASGRDFQPVCFGPACFGATIQAPPLGPS